MALRSTAHPQRSAREKPPIWHNGRLARLNTEPTLDALNGEISFIFQEVTYFDGQSSNELWRWSRGDVHEGKVERIPKFLAVDGRVYLLRLDQSQMANIVGVTIIAITSDERILFVHQSTQNSVCPNGFAASASGSLDWSDVLACRGSGELDSQQTDTPQDVLMKGMLRELAEEVSVKESEIIEGSQVVTGYFRWLSRGAKTEFSGLVKLNVASEDLLKRTVRGEEQLYTNCVVAVPLSLLLERRPEMDHPALASQEVWKAEQIELIGALAEVRGINPKEVRLSASTLAAWHSAGDYIKSHPEYLA